MKRIFAVLCTILCLISLFACKKTPETPPEEEPVNKPFSVEVPEYRMISIWHYPIGEATATADDSVVYSDLFSMTYFQELVAELESSTLTPDPEAEFDYSEYYDINFYPNSSIQQYAVSVSVNGVVNAERKLCRVSEGAFSFSRVAGYFEIVKNLPPAPTGGD